MADQRRIDMKMSGKPEEENWILVINGKRANVSGGYVKTKADLLKMKKYMGMVTQKVRDAYNKRLAELSKSKSADSIDAIADKYGHEVRTNDAVGFDREKEKAANDLTANEKKISYAEVARKSLGSGVTVHFDMSKKNFVIGIKNEKNSMNIMEAKSLAQNLLKACKIVEQAPN